MAHTCTCKWGWWAHLIIHAKKKTEKNFGVDSFISTKMTLLKFPNIKKLFIFL